MERVNAGKGALSQSRGLSSAHTAELGWAAPAHPPAGGRSKLCSGQEQTTGMHKNQARTYKEGAEHLLQGFKENPHPHTSEEHQCSISPQILPSPSDKRNFSCTGLHINSIFPPQISH